MSPPPPPGTFGNVWRHFWGSLLGKAGGRVLLASGGEEPEMLPHPECTAGPALPCANMVLRQRGPIITGKLKKRTLREP